MKVENANSFTEPLKIDDIKFSDIKDGISSDVRPLAATTISSVSPWFAGLNDQPFIPSTQAVDIYWNQADLFGDGRTIIESTGQLIKAIRDAYSSGGGSGSVSETVSWNNVTGKPNTLSGFGITDAKISNGTITLGSNTITPITSHQSLTNYATKSMLTDGSVTKVGTSTVGSSQVPMYLNAGVPTPCVGSSMFSNLSISGNTLSVTVADQNRTVTLPSALSPIPDTSNFVTLTGNETISGIKTFTNGIRVNDLLISENTIINTNSGGVINFDNNTAIFQCDINAEDNTITASKIKLKNGKSSQVLMADGSTKDVSSFNSGTTVKNPLENGGRYDNIDLLAHKELYLGSQGNIELTAGEDNLGGNVRINAGWSYLQVNNNDAIKLGISGGSYNNNTKYTFGNKLYFGETANSTENIGAEGSKLVLNGKNGIDLGVSGTGSVYSNANITSAQTVQGKTVVATNGMTINNVGLTINGTGSLTMNGTGQFNVNNASDINLKTSSDYLTFTGAQGISIHSSNRNTSNYIELRPNDSSIVIHNSKSYVNETIIQCTDDDAIKIFTGDQGIILEDKGDITINNGDLNVLRGSVRSRGNTLTSDETLKDIISNVTIDINDIADARLVKYTFIDDPKKTVNVGTIAQDWETILPEVVTKDKDNKLSMDYNAANMASSITLAREVRILKEAIKNLSERVAALENV